MVYEPRVLIGTPIYDKKYYALEKQLKYIKELKYNNYDQVFFENSKSDKYYYKLKEKGLKVVRVNRGKNSRDALANSMNMMRYYFLKNNYDYLLVLENDLFPDPYIIQRLLSHNKPVVGSYYLIGLKEDEEVYQELLKKLKKNLLSPEEFKKKMSGLFIRTPCLFVTEKKQDSGFLGTRILKRKEGFNMFRTGLRKIHGCGLGATLIHKDVVKRFPFYYDNRFNDKHPDVYFYADLQDAGVPVYVDTSVCIKHEPSDWKKVRDR